MVRLLCLLVLRTDLGKAANSQPTTLIGKGPDNRPSNGYDAVTLVVILRGAEGRAPQDDGLRLRRATPAFAGTTSNRSS